MTNNNKKNHAPEDFSRYYSDEKDSFAKIQSHAKRLMVELDRRVPKEIRSKEGGICGAELSSADVLRFIKTADSSIYQICKELAKIEKARLAQPGEEVATIDNSGAESLVSIINREAAFGIKTPYIKRVLNPKAPTALPYADLIDVKVSATTPLATHLRNAPVVCVYSISVYPANTPCSMILDSDNEGLKQPIDFLTRRLGRDDNGLTTNLILGAVLRDDLYPGTYTFIVEKSSDFVPVDQAIDRFIMG